MNKCITYKLVKYVTIGEFQHQTSSIVHRTSYIEWNT